MTSANIRRAVFAGSWYPARASECEKEIKTFLKEEKKMDVPGRKLVGGIVRSGKRGASRDR